MDGWVDNSVDISRPMYYFFQKKIFWKNDSYSVFKSKSCSLIVWVSLFMRKWKVEHIWKLLEFVQKKEIVEKPRSDE